MTPIRLDETDRVADLRRIDQDRRGVDTVLHVAMDKASEAYADLARRSQEWWDALAARRGLDLKNMQYTVEHRADGDHLVESPGRKHAAEAEKGVFDREDVP